jgi:DNA-binding transcriptional LysR family regulator
MRAKIPEYNLNHFKVFMAVYETGSMTAAAELLHLTQSGVSQHIKALESDLGLPLFSRVGRKLVPTEIATQIFPDIDNVFSVVSARLARVTGKELEPEGEVRIGMPIEFGVNKVVPKLAAFGRKQQKISFEITLDYASVLSQALLRNELDFAFVDEFPKDRRLDYKAVATEDLLLCAGKDYVAARPPPRKGKLAQAYFEELDYIEYKGSEPILRRWMLHHLKRKNLKLNVRAHIMDVQGVAKFITSGLGAGVLPDHVVAKLKSDGVELHVFEGKGKPLRNEIRLVKLKGHDLSRPAKLALAELSL